VAVLRLKKQYLIPQSALLLFRRQFFHSLNAGIVRPFLLIIFVVLSFSEVAYAQERQSEIIEAAENACLDSTGNQSTMGMLDCALRARQQWDTLLIREYKLLQKKLKPAARAKLLTSERQWIQYKEAQWQLLVAFYGGPLRVSMYKVIMVEEFKDIIKSRAIALEHILSDPELWDDDKH